MRRKVEGEWEGGGEDVGKGEMEKGGEGWWWWVGRWGVGVSDLDLGVFFGVGGRWDG